MTNQKGHSMISSIITILVTALVAGYGVYYYTSTDLQQKNISQKTEIETAKEEGYNLLIKQGEDYKNTILKIKSDFPKGADFKLEFPWTWGLVQVERMDLTATDAPSANVPQYVGYKIISENQPLTHFFTIYISKAEFKDSDLVTQGGRVFLAEDEKFFYNYTIPNRDICGKDVVNCSEDKAAKIIDDIKGVIQTFEMLK
jgi:hypothetical protein